MDQRFLDLTTLADRFHTDKGSTDGDGHLYTELYSACFESFRLAEFNLLELGLLRAPSDEEEAHPEARRVTRCPSADMWLAYFPNATIHGFDLADFSALQRPRFRFLRGDLSLDADIDRLADWVPEPRIIIDDASHAAYHQQRAFLRLFPVLAPGGFYVIEDLHYAPPFEGDLSACRGMAEVVRGFVDTGRLTLDFGSPADAAAIAARISHTFIHCSARGRQTWGAKLVIFQKSRLSAADVPADRRSALDMAAKSSGSN